jgi:hypothetical protein
MLHKSSAPLPLFAHHGPGSEITMPPPQASALPPDAESQRRQWLAELTVFWHRLLEALASCCLDGHPAVREHALVLLHNVLTAAVDRLHLGADAWGTTWRELLLPMLNELASTMQARSQLCLLHDAGLQRDSSSLCCCRCLTSP